MKALLKFLLETKNASRPLSRGLADGRRVGLPLMVGLALVTLPIAAQVGPLITEQPVGLSRSLGDRLTFSVKVTGDAPLHFQWQFNSSPILGATNRLLTLTNLNQAHAGNYSVVVSNSINQVASEAAVLDVNTLFRVLVDSPVSRDAGYSMSWGDFDQDGYVDLHSAGDAGHLLYHNEGNGSFIKVSPTNALVKSSYSSGSVGAGYWVDYNNDGKLDFFAPTGWGYNGPKILFRGLGGGQFEGIKNNPLVLDRSSAWSAVWADFNRDGWLDLFLANGRNSDGSVPAENSVYLGQPDGSFLRWRPDGLSGFLGKSYGCTAGDFNGDGFPDVAVTVRDPARTVIFMNRAGADFEAVTVGTGGDGWGSVIAGDYDNTGTLDLFSTWVGKYASLFRNAGPENWEQIFGVDLVNEPPRSESATWGDFDNDGWLDLFVSRLNDYTGSGDQNDILWHNNGDGTFSPVAAGSVTQDGLHSFGAAWGDFDNDGFLDLAVAAISPEGTDHSRLYRNSGNSNSWLLIKLIGTKSNRSAIGAKVRLAAQIRGRALTQFRELGTGAGWGQNDPRVHFGLGDATRVDRLEIEWPSGQKQVIENLNPKRILTITEPGGLPRLRAGADGTIHLEGDPNTSYAIESSLQLATWTPRADLGVTTDNAGVATVAVSGGPIENLPAAFFLRARIR